MSEIAPLTNGNQRRRSRRPPRLDMRTWRGKQAKFWSQRFDAIYKKILLELPTDAVGHISEWQKQEARGCAQLIVSRERMETESAATGEAIDPQIYTMLIEQQARSFSRLGLEVKGLKS
jgi:hypothetical protein